ncbi:hypothetical protein C1752_04479 [Acaryochloris thomasi RCC1774]|uniref:CENP-V/GFA domain-containing protein n=1 Tax=Acaryochloris thomasi RCC1774 TaxID=1764569 RepID=A0A2W1JNU1_9CYAN|nr:DUF6151 family protein [Acaryochloris thomasi]PZD71814.1 hypothetical protein C1752_04479 [Acaryochloris thomasi RCC1774]
MSHSIQCSCGKLKGTLNPNGDVNRCVCYCADCQAFARFLKKENETLDERGGTTIIQTLPAHVAFTEGMEYLSCMCLTSNGLLRWYAACCHTPIGNTPPNLNMSFVGLIHTCLNSDQSSLDEAFGSACMHVNTKHAIGEDKPKPTGVLFGTFRILGMMLKARFDGSYKRTPFFVVGSGTPISMPKVLSDQELEDVMPVA